jgi:hypothetical protein
MKRSLIALAVIGSVALTGCAGSMTLDDGGRYDAYRTSVVELAAAAQETERIRILALSRLAETADDRTRDRIVSELSVRTQPQAAQSAQLAAPAAPTHLGLEALRVLGPGAIGLIGQGISAYNQQQADIQATARHNANNALIGATVQGALSANTELGLTGMGLAEQAVSKLPATITVHAPAPAAAAPVAAPAPAPAAPTE